MIYQFTFHSRTKHLLKWKLISTCGKDVKNINNTENNSDNTFAYLPDRNLYAFENTL